MKSPRPIRRFCGGAVGITAAARPTTDQIANSHGQPPLGLTAGHSGQRSTFTSKTTAIARGPPAAATAIESGHRSTRDEIRYAAVSRFALPAVRERQRPRGAGCAHLTGMKQRREQLDADDDARPRPAEVGVAVEGVDLAGTHRRKVRPSGQ